MVYQGNFVSQRCAKGLTVFTVYPLYMDENVQSVCKRFTPFMSNVHWQEKQTKEGLRKIAGLLFFCNLSISLSRLATIGKRQMVKY
jgi:hypothetical protein